MPLVVLVVGQTDAPRAALKSHFLDVATVIVDGWLLRRHSRPDFVKELRAKLEHIPVSDVAIRRVRLRLQELLSLCPHDPRMLDTPDLNSQAIAWELPDKLHLLQQVINIFVVTSKYLVRRSQANVHLAQGIEHVVTCLRELVDQSFGLNEPLIMHF